MEEDFYKNFIINTQKDMDLLEQCIQEEMNYLLAEGFIEDVGNGRYRIFTEQELQDQLNQLSQ